MTSASQPLGTKEPPGDLVKMHTLHSVPGWGLRASISKQLPGEAMLLVQGPPVGIEVVTGTEHHEGEGSGHMALLPGPHWVPRERQGVPILG